MLYLNITQNWTICSTETELLIEMQHTRLGLWGDAIIAVSGWLRQKRKDFFHYLVSAKRKPITCFLNILFFSLILSIIFYFLLCKAV